MPEDPMDPIRVKDKDLGYDSTIRRMSLPHGNYQVLKQDAVDPLTGEFLPPDFHLDDAAEPTVKKELS